MTLSEYIDSIKDRRIAVIGIGVSNEPLTELLLKSGCHVTACDRRSLRDSDSGAASYSARSDAVSSGKR